MRVLGGGLGFEGLDFWVFFRVGEGRGYVRRFRALR